MPDYGHDLTFGAFITPSAKDADLTVALTAFAEQVGYDLVTFQDHPYLPTFLDTWTLLSYVAARTERVTLCPNVLNLPLRQPAVMARSVASLDLLTGGRVELGLGAGAFWDGIEANGGRRLSPGQAVDALDEAIQVIRAVWSTEPGGVRVDGDYYRVVGAKRGPAPAHDVGIWLGAYKPRMLALVGRAADGWLPSLSHLPGGSSDLDGMNEIIDESAVLAGREPTDVRRLLNIGADVDPEQIAAIALEHGTSTFILGSDEPTVLQRFMAETAPAVRDLVTAEREGHLSDVSSAGPHETSDTVTVTADRAASTVPPALAGIATVDDGVRLSARTVWDESTRPVAPAPPTEHVYDERSTYVSKHLVDVHDHLRQELTTVRGLVEQVKGGALSVGDARSAINEMTMRQNDWTLGAYCASYCRVVTGHHSLEDAEVFPHLKRADPGLAPVIDRLHEEHLVIHEVLEEVDAALVAFVADSSDFSALEDALNLLSDTLLSHLAYEEQQIVEPLARLGFYAGQI